MGLRPPTAAELNTPTVAELNTPKATEAVKEEEIPSILFIMDGSGSMHSMKNEPLNGLKKFVDKQKESGDFLFTLVVFDDTPQIVFDNISGVDIPTLTKEEHYDAENGGCTALYDSIAFSINLQKERKTKKVIVVIITDGLENTSHTYDKTQINEMISDMTEKHKWKFMYLGANQNAFAVGKGLGITKSGGYQATERGCCQLFSTVSHEVSRCISGDVQVEDFNPDLETLPEQPPCLLSVGRGSLPQEDFGGSIGPSMTTVPDLRMNEEEDFEGSIGPNMTTVPDLRMNEEEDFEVISSPPPSIGFSYSK